MDQLVVRTGLEYRQIFRAESGFLSMGRKSTERNAGKTTQRVKKIEADL